MTVSNDNTFCTNSKAFTLFIIRTHLGLEVYNLIGRQLAEPVEGNFDAEYHDVTFSASDLASGVYFGLRQRARLQERSWRFRPVEEVRLVEATRLPQSLFVVLI